MRVPLMFIFLVVFFFASCAQGKKDSKYPEGYHIDESIAKKEITSDAKINVEWITESKQKTPMMDGENIPHYATYTIENDTFRIVLMHTFFPTGMLINVYKDSAWAIHFFSSKDQSLRRFKKNKEDTIYEYSPDAKPTSFTLVLYQKPIAGEPIKGYINFKSASFYEASSGGDVKRAYNAEGWFVATKLY